MNKEIPQVKFTLRQDSFKQIKKIHSNFGLRKELNLSMASKTNDDFAFEEIVQMNKKGIIPIVYLSSTLNRSGNPLIIVTKFTF